MTIRTGLLKGMASSSPASPTAGGPAVAAPEQCAARNRFSDRWQTEPALGWHQPEQGAPFFVSGLKTPTEKQSNRGPPPPNTLRSAP